jgi:hypothetical protein
MKGSAPSILSMLLFAGAFACPVGSREDSTVVAQTRRAEPELRDQVRGDRRLERVVQRVRDVERRARALGSRWADVRQGYLRAQQAFTAAEVKYQVAARSSDVASTTFSAARTAWDEARWRWELYQQLVLVAAAIDAHNLDRFRALTGNQIDSLDCSEGMTVRAFRELLISRGVDLQGKDIDHIVPRSLGGAAHPANYRVLDSGLNRSLRDSWGPGKCRFAGRKCAGAIAISRKCGHYRGPEF